MSKNRNKENIKKEKIRLKKSFIFILDALDIRKY